MRFRTPVSILHVLGGELNNDLILLLMSTSGCLVKTKAGYALFSNGMVERYNGIIIGMLTKLRNEKFWECSLEATIAHALFVKRSILDANGFYS